MDNNNLFNNTNTDPAGDAVNPTAEPAKPDPAAEPVPAAEPAPVAAPAPAAEPAPIADSAPAANPAPDPQPAPAYGSYTAQSQAPARPDFTQYQNASAHYTSIPRETVYINNQPVEPAVKKKKEKARIGVGAVALIVAVCMIFSGGAAFIGTYAANRITNQPSSGNPSISTGTPSVIFQAQSNQNKAPGTYTQVAEAVAPTVVEIVTESVVTASLWGGSYVTSGAGSGVIISSNGLIITNNHVVSGAETIKVTLKDGTEYTAKLLGTDSDSDIAVIKVEAENLPCALVGNSEDIAVGQEVIAVGNPLGEFGGSVTNGIISALSREITIDGVTMTLLQTNAAVNPGNSGGGLFNLYGELVGIVNAKSSTTSSGTAVEGIGFAIPINDATKVATELVNYGYVKGKPYLGINIVDVTTAMEAYQYGVNQLGLYIRSSEFTEELKSGDRIIGIDNKEVTYSTDLKAALRSYKVGDEVTLTVVRKGQYVEVKVTLHEYVPATADQSGFEKNADKDLQN